MKVLVTGGLGYVGSVLVPILLQDARISKVVVYDLNLYGNYLKPHSKLKVIEADIRDVEKLKNSLKNVHTVIHLACISNDPSFELDPALGKSVNLDSFIPLVESCKSTGVCRFINASSSSVYGVKDEPHVTEDMSLNPLTDYSKYKAQTEEILLEVTKNYMESVSIRSATVFGYSPRQRLDVIVNILTNHAYHNRRIKIMGSGRQLRPNVHIKDIAYLYYNLCFASSYKIDGEIFNYGGPNYSVLKIADIVKSQVGEDVITEFVPSNDDRSYQISSQKITNKLGFIPSNDILYGVHELVEAFKVGLLKDTFNNKNYFNIEAMKTDEVKKKLGVI